jgi:hypothetical protein
MQGVMVFNATFNNISVICGGRNARMKRKLISKMEMEKNGRKVKNRYL